VKNLKWLLILSFLTISLSSCSYVKQLFKRPTKQKTPTVTATFKAIYNGRSFEGFLRVSEGNMRMDIVNSLGLASYGLYVHDNRVWLKDYNTQKTYTKLNVDSNDLTAYKSMILYCVNHFFELCQHRPMGIIVLQCKQLGTLNVPKIIVFFRRGGRLRLNLSNLKLLKKE